MTVLTELQIKNMIKPISEAVNSRGDGSLYFEKQGDTISAFYRYSFEKKGRKILLDNFKPAHSKAPGSTLKELREKSREYSNLKKKYPDLKGHFEYEKKQKQLEAQIKANTGSFEDMLNSYIDSLSNPNTQKAVRNLFKRDVINPFQELAETKASDITVNDIVLILKRLFQRKVTTRQGKQLDRTVTTGGNRLRTYLSAAFSHAVMATNDPLKQDKIFNVQVNPVLNIPKQTQFEKTQDRSLSLEEVKHLLTHIDKTNGVSEIKAQTIKFLFYVAGQRPLQVLRETWDSYDYRKKTLHITDTKGRGSKREYLTPITPRAFAILDSLPTQDKAYPFTTDGETAIRVETLLKAIQKYCKQYDVEKFTLRDIRRTCKNLLIEAGVNRETRNLIQNHGLTGVDFKHYDKHDHLPEKISGMNKYDQLLEKLLTDNSDNVVQLMTAQ